MAISAFIMAGGRSSRMGTDKAWLRIGEQFVIERVIAALKPVSDDLALIASKDKYKDYERLGLPVFTDIIKDYGPLGGIHTALTNTKNERNLIVGCDLPFVTAQLFEKLLAVSTDYEIVVPLNAEGRTEQMCALYTKGCVPAIEIMYDEGVQTPRSLFECRETKYLDWTDLACLSGADHFFDNLNTPEDYARAIGTFSGLVRQ